MEKSDVEELICKLKSTSFSDENERVIIDTLYRLTELMESDQFRNSLNTEHWNVIGELCENASRILVKENKSDEDYELLISLLRFLRNSLAGCCENERKFIKVPSVCNFARGVMQHFLDAKSPRDLLILKISTQVFGNVRLCDRNTIDLVWNVFQEFHIVRRFTPRQLKDILETTMKVLYECLNEENGKNIYSIDYPESFLRTMKNLQMQKEMPWTPEVMNLLLMSDILFTCYKSFNSSQRCTYLEAFYTHLEEYKGEEILPDSMNKLIDIFETESDQHLFLTAQEMRKMLSIFCKASVLDPYMPILQSKKELLKVCVVRLANHTERSENNSCILAESESCHGCKSQLIQLIGNLSYKCKENQDLVRSLDGIPLILDNCRLDENNPFIREWCILAIRNLLENNLHNQAIVAGISSRGEVIQSEYLSSIGLEAQNEDGQIRIIPKP